MPTTIAEFKQAFSTAARPDSTQADYKAARRAALEAFDDCFVQARLFDELEAARHSLRMQRKEMVDAAERGDYPAALQQATQLQRLAAEYLKRAKAIQKKIDAVGEKMIAEINQASWCQEDDVARKWVEEKLMSTSRPSHSS
jgi:hypothetical protein